MNYKKPLSLLLIPVLFYAFTAGAGLYKGLDEEGNVVYSDKPFKNSKQFVPPSITVVEAAKVPPKEELAEEEEENETTYTKLSITAPTNDQVIWNAPDVAVALQLSPTLDTAAEHSIWLIMDGNPLVKKSQSLLLQIGRIDRGEHKLQAQVRNKDGKVIKSSKMITVHIKHATIRRN